MPSRAAGIGLLSLPLEGRYVHKTRCFYFDSSFNHPPLSLHLMLVSFFLTVLGVRLRNVHSLLQTNRADYGPDRNQRTFYYTTRQRSMSSCD